MDDNGHPTLTGSQLAVLVRLAAGPFQSTRRWVAAESVLRKGLVARQVRTYSLTAAGGAALASYTHVVLIRITSGWDRFLGVDAPFWRIWGAYQSREAAERQAGDFVARKDIDAHVVVDPQHAARLLAAPGGAK